VLFKIYILGEDTNKYPRPFHEDANALKKFFDSLFGGGDKPEEKKDANSTKVIVQEIEDKPETEKTSTEEKEEKIDNSKKDSEGTEKKEKKKRRNKAK